MNTGCSRSETASTLTPTGISAAQTIALEDEPSPTAAAPETGSAAPTPTLNPFVVESSSFPVPPAYILYIRDLETGLYYSEVRAVAPDGTDDRLLMTGQHLTEMAFMPSVGRRYLAFSVQKPYVLDLNTGEITVLDQREEWAIASFFWISDSVLYYTWRDQTGWSTWRTEMPPSQERQLVLNPPEGTVLMHVLDDQRVVISEPLENYRRQTVVLHWRTGERLPIQGDYQLTDLSPNQTRAILYGHDDGREGGYVIGFYIADIDLAAGRYANSIRVNPSNGAAGYDYQPAFSPDGRHIIAKRLLTGDQFGSEIVLISFDQESFTEEPLTPMPDQVCWTAVWYSSSQIVAPCRDLDANKGPGAIWLLPIDGSPGIRLTESGRPIMVP